MDHIDRKIIDILQQNARAPLKEIADRVFLSSPAVSARIARLEKERREAAKLLEFELAAALRDQIIELRGK